MGVRGATPSPAAIRIGTAGWAISAAQAEALPGEGTHLERYARRMNCVEINSSFYRSHRMQTYARWADSTPDDFRFAVKLPKRITHECRFEGVDELLAAFVAEAGGLGAKWAVTLVQLPPSLAFDDKVAGRFFEQLGEAFDGAVVCEPRHLSWFTPQAEQLLEQCEVARAAVDPSKWPQANEPGGWTGPATARRPAVFYHRWHGSPRIYWSTYKTDWLRERAQELAQLPAHADRWCIFDNTAAGAALPNALQLETLTSP
ncbi:DUF72 domain-containing protein [Rhizobacter sp. OV335]|uniref:DUF72 domain-containing protein n=1 Tax=Rhizobacter sp. OV335 TaxID=1500264 RepID=UPI0009124E58|nr:DUF72 domain-containing protein [Rhizobacter sp. OV335]SHM28406.1 Uncharacterized conserved protein YecE, DUF72 family [Rhizobacter sp. OV335]